ncbi:hypothetical protein MKW94_019527 [Papaver nudicaule]|uniref:Coenzyme Q-binding protein COQ10 START domain-containing protein n=1 Tax=Papaver nudicaule TaxID=74823 RepID=A0AA41VEX6_PAPNU|nr:hypothetical protein [Papaver nudicaule]
MMVPFTSASTAIARLLSRKNGVGMFVKSVKSSSTIGRYSQIRQLSSIAGIEIPCVSNLVGTHKDYKYSFGNTNYDFQKFNDMQKRCFLGCGDGSHGNVLSKTHEERHVLGYSPEQLFAVVAAVDLYEDFVPWCQRSKIVRNNPDGSFDAELEIGFKFLIESYVSHVELIKPKSIKTTVSESNLFDHLINIWEFNPGPVPGTCDLHFLVDFKFQSPLYRQVATVFFTEVATRLVGSFVDRCRVIYGPGVEVLEKSY